MKLSGLSFFLEHAQKLLKLNLVLVLFLFLKSKALYHWIRCCVELYHGTIPRTFSLLLLFITSLQRNLGLISSRKTLLQNLLQYCTVRHNPNPVICVISKYKSNLRKCFVIDMTSNDAMRCDAMRCLLCSFLFFSDCINNGMVCISASDGMLREP